MEQSKPLQLPKEWVDKIDRSAKEGIRLKGWGESLQFESYVKGAMSYAPWLYTGQMNYAALQAKCERYEKALKDVQNRSRPQDMIYIIVNKALSGEGKEVNYTCNKCGNENANLIKGNYCLCDECMRSPEHI